MLLFSSTCLACWFKMPKKFQIRIINNMGVVMDGAVGHQCVPEQDT